MHLALTSLIQDAIAALCPLGNVSVRSSWTMAVSQLAWFISVTKMSATPPEPARINHGVEFWIVLYILYMWNGGKVTNILFYFSSIIIYTLM